MQDALLYALGANYNSWQLIAAIGGMTGGLYMFAMLLWRIYYFAIVFPRERNAHGEYTAQVRNLP